MDAAFFFKQLIKMGVQHVYLPLLYLFFRAKKVNKNFVLFSDAHHDSIPFSMELIRERVGQLGGFQIYEMYLDIQKCGTLTLIKWLNKFMKLYARAGYVFICDNHLPVSSCKKRKETKVIQLWHSGGLLKKAGYDTPDTIPKMYIGNVYKNYDLFTVSAPCCIDIIKSSMRQPDGVVKATGVSRTDIYYSDEFIAECKKDFYREYPEAKGKKTAVWLPTFRGNAAQPLLCGEEELDAAFAALPEFFLIKKYHPHYENKHPDLISCKIPSQRLLAVADLLITDYSSVVFDYLVYNKPFVLFAPDHKEYEKNHGFYLPYDSYPATVAETTEQLIDAIKYEMSERDPAELKKCYDYHMKMCDGHATDRILKEAGLIN